MRIHLQLSPNTIPVPFNYQVSLAGTFHKWLGEDNQQHDTISLYSFSWLQGGKMINGGFQFQNGANWFISSHDPAIVKAIVKGIMDDGEVNFGMKVQGISLQENPNFGNMQKFVLASPVLIKRFEVGQNQTFYRYDHEKADELLTETLRRKLQIAGIANEDVKVHFDRSYPKAKTKMVNYKGINNRANFCPVIVQGSPETIAFAWNVGVGNSTGIGFGSLL